MSSVLAANLVLGEGLPGRIDDAEALVRKVADDRLRQWGARLKEGDYEELVSYLIGVCWELSGRYDPAKERNPARANFAAYASKILTLRVADWYRQGFGDTRHADRPIVLSLDGPALSGGDGEDQDRLGQLVDTLAASTGDPAADRAPDLVGILSGGGSKISRSHDTVGEPPPGGTQKRNLRPARSPAAMKKGRVPGTYRQAPPICSECFQTFHAAFMEVENAKPAEKRRPEREIVMRARGRARAVRIGGQYVCPRHTSLENPEAQKAFLAEAYSKTTAAGGKRKAKRKRRAAR